MKKIVLCLLLVFGITTVHSQEYSVFVSFNEYFPRSENNKSEYPFLWYSSENKKVLFGGFGVGIKFKKKVKTSNLDLKGNVSLFRFKQYDQPFQLSTDGGGTPRKINGIINEYGLGIQGGAGYNISEKISIGSGLKITTLISSKTHYKSIKLNIKNRYYRPILLTIPIELSFDFERINLTSKYEIGVSNRLRGETSSKEHGNMLSLEIGYILNNKIKE